MSRQGIRTVHLKKLPIPAGPCPECAEVRLERLRLSGRKRWTTV